MVVCTQFTKTMVVLQHHLLQRLSQRRTSIQNQQEFQVVHLHVDSNMTNYDMYALSKWVTTLGRENVPMILPIDTGVWEMIGRKSCFKKLQDSLHHNLSTQAKLEEINVLPKGIAARAAQVYSQVPLIDRRVARLYIDVLHRFPFHHVMKDIAESFALQPPMSGIIDGWICLFGGSLLSKVDMSQLLRGIR